MSTWQERLAWANEWTPPAGVDLAYGIHPGRDLVVVMVFRGAVSLGQISLTWRVMAPAQVHALLTVTCKLAPPLTCPEGADMTDPVARALESAGARFERAVAPRVIGGCECGGCGAL